MEGMMNQSIANGTILFGLAIAGIYPTSSDACRTRAWRKMNSIRHSVASRYTALAPQGFPMGFD